MANDSALDRRLPHPFSAAFGMVGYLGRLAILASTTFWSSVRPSTSFAGETSRQLDRLLGMGLPSVALVHIGLGSFLSMQAYFGATFVDGIGPVVGVGLIRNLAPLMVGFILAGLVAARYVAELRGLDIPQEELARLVAPRVAAAMIAGPILSAWGSIIGIFVGWAVARSIMGLTFPAFFDMFLEMLWTRDVVGLVVKGLVFGGAAGLLACHEGVARPSGSDPAPEAICSAACRAAYLAGLAVLAFNATWFLLVYHAGPAFGPTVLVPPTG
ncbi:ABC transporter permease [Tundrisphaera lichenicola]|uniref:ABC transporter permease n=1 Tax=Tundrisphaera lichenicola TaxID=2029860 RepID=UPI003EBDE8B7